MRLGGWQRLGVVLSVTWAVGGGLWLRIADVKKADEIAGVFFRVCVADQSRGAGGRDCSLELQNNLVAFTPSWSRAAFTALLPIPVAWGVGFCLIALVRWVRDGWRAP